MGSAHPFKNRLKQITQKGEISGLFEPTRMQSSTEGAFPPEKMNWMHADLQIEVEKQLHVEDLKTPRLACPGQYFLSTKKRSFCQSQVGSHQLPLLLCLLK